MPPRTSFRGQGRATAGSARIILSTSASSAHDTILLSKMIYWRYDYNTHFRSLSMMPGMIAATWALHDIIIGQLRHSRWSNFARTGPQSRQYGDAGWRRLPGMIMIRCCDDRLKMLLFTGLFCEIWWCCARRRALWHDESPRVLRPRAATRRHLPQMLLRRTTSLPRICMYDTR